MIKTDGKRTIANTELIPGQLDLVEAVAEYEAAKSAAKARGAAASRHAHDARMSRIFLADDHDLAQSA